jgi:DNA-binding transcriptional LysR family regulator
VRLTDAFRFVVVGSPDYLAQRGTPQRPEEQLEHECVALRSPTTGGLYAWELERGRRSWRIPVHGGIVTNHGFSAGDLAASGCGLAYVPEPGVKEHLSSGRLKVVLDRFAPSVPGWFLYFPSRAQRSKPLQVFVAVAKAVLLARPR